MSATEDRSVRVLELAEEFLERHRGGEAPSIEEYVDRHPELADQIREVFPAVAMVEDIAIADESLHSGGRGPAPAASAMMTPNRLGDFRIIREVGRGGLGVVFEAEQISLGRHVALKVLPLQGAAGSVKLRRFLFEARAAARLHHSNIVPVYAVGEQDGVHYYAMQFIQGQGLDVIFAELRAHEEGAATMTLSAPASLMTGSLVDRHELTTGPWPTSRGGVTEAGESASTDRAGSHTAPPAADVSVRHQPAATHRRISYFRSVARVGRDVAEALAYAHSQGIVHRDIKPSNLILDADGTVWITDFGLATGKGSDDLTATGDVVGTLRYMAPERFEGGSEPRSDVYSLGATLYELLTLQPIFDESDRARLMKLVAHEAPIPPRKLDLAIPLDLETIVLKAIAKVPDHRYESAAEMAEDLRRYLEGRPIVARRISPVERVVRWSRRDPDLAAWMATVLLILLLSSVGMALLWRSAENQRRRADKLLELSETRRRETEKSRDEAQRYRAEAEAHFTKARAAVDELLTRVSESQLLNVPGLQPLRKDLLLSAMAYYEDFVRERADDPTLKAGLATAELQLGIILRELGAAEQSEQALRRAMGLLESTLRARPDDPRLRAGMAKCCANLGVLGLDPVHPRMAPDEARPLLVRAIGLWEGLAHAEPKNVGHLAELANAYNLLAVLDTHNGRPDESLRSQQASIGLRERLAVTQPEDPSFQGDLASSLNNLGALLDRTGVEGLDQLRIFRRAAAHGRLAFARAPQVIRYGRFLAVTLRNIAVAERAHGRHDGAEAAFREALEVSRRLLRDNPAVPMLRAEFVQDYRSLGDVLRERGRIAEGVRLYRESWAPARAMRRTTAEDWSTAAALLGLCARPAVDAGGLPDEAERAESRRFGDAAMAALRRAIAAGFKNADVVRVGDEFAALRGREDFPPVLARAEAAAHGQTPPAEFARVPFPPPGVASGRSDFRAPAEPEEPAPGGAAAGADPAAASRAAGTSKDRVPLEEEQASSQHALGLVQLELGESKEARASLLRALALRESLVQSDPEEVRHQVDLAATRAAIGRLEWRLGRPADAMRDWTETRDGLESARQAHPNDPTIAEQLAALELIVGHSHAEAALWEEAAAAFERAASLGSRDRLTARSRASLMAVPGDRNGLEALCARMLDDYGESSEAMFTNRAAHWCALVPRCVPDPSLLVPMAEKSVAAGHIEPEQRFHLALAAYRAGHFEEAVRQAERSLADVRTNRPGLQGPLDEAVLAMALHRLGRVGDAARRLQGVMRLGWDAVEQRCEPQDWWERADFVTLKREAIATVTGKPAPDDPELRKRRGRVYSQLGQTAQSVAEFQAAEAAAKAAANRSK
jgi:serine/threonine-protein kinase